VTNSTDIWSPTRETSWSKERLGLSTLPLDLFHYPIFRSLMHLLLLINRVRLVGVIGEYNVVWMARMKVRGLDWVLWPAVYRRRDFRVHIAFEVWILAYYNVLLQLSTRHFCGAQCPDLSEAWRYYFRGWPCGGSKLAKTWLLREPYCFPVNW